jgi:hypothetical protein
MGFVVERDRGSHPPILHHFRIRCNWQNIMLFLDFDAHMQFRCTATKPVQLKGFDCDYQHTSSFGPTIFSLCSLFFPVFQCFILLQSPRIQSRSSPFPA